MPLSKEEQEKELALILQEEIWKEIEKEECMPAEIIKAGMDAKVIAILKKYAKDNGIEPVPVDEDDA